MDHCTVGDNSATGETGVSGGGIFANTNSTLIIEHCSVSGNKASGSGGGIYAGGGSLTLVNSTVGGDQDYDGNHTTKSKGNKAKSGGGIFANGQAKVTIDGGTLSFNKVENGNGGGVYAENIKTFTLKNAAISSNIAMIGGGIYLRGGATFTMKGSSCITPSSAGDANVAGKNDVYLTKYGDGNIAKISLPEVLSGTAPVVARITIADDQYLSTTQVLDGAAVGTEYSKFTVTPKTVSGGTQIWTIKNDGHLQKPPVEINGTDSLAWKKLKDAVAAADDGDVIKIIGEIKATNDTDNSGELVVNKNITVKKADGASSAVIDANKDAGGKPKHRIFFVRSGSTLTLDNITLQGGMAEGSAENKLGGGVYVNGTLIMKGSSKITDCSAGEGGGLFLFGTCTLQDSSSITQCEARDYGGGVCVDYFGRSILNINGGSITMNHTKKVPSSTGHGGGVYVRGNTSTKGKVVMTAGEISDNKAGFNSGSTYEGDGGGIYNSGIFEMSGGTIKSNNAKNGGGVCISDSGTFTMSGNAKIEADNDVYFGSTGGNPTFITVTGALSNSPAATLTMENIAGYAEGREVVKGDGYTLTAADIARFPITAQQTSPVQNWTTELDGNTLKLKKERKTVTIKRTDANAWKKLKDEVEKTSGGAEKIIIEGTVQAKDGSKGEITVSREVEIEGNGTDAVLDAQLNNRIFKVNTAGKLTIKNLKLTGGLSNGAALQSENYGGAIYNEGELTVISCEMRDNFAEHSGGGAIYVKHGGKCTIKGTGARKTIIAKNEASKGGGIQINGECTVDEYTVIGGSAGDANKGKQYAGGILVASTGKCTIKGGVEISYNTLTETSGTKGGGIFVEDFSGNKGELILEGSAGKTVTIKENKATNGAGIYCEGTIPSMKHTEIKNCTAARNGGGIYLANNASVKMGDNAEITDCSTENANYGGGVYVDSDTCTFEMSGSAKVTVSTGADKNKEGANEIFLKYGEIKVTGTLTVGDGQAGRISVISSKYHTSTVVLTGDNLPTNSRKFTVTKQKGLNQAWKVSPSGKLQKN